MISGIEMRPWSHPVYWSLAISLFRIVEIAENLIQAHRHKVPRNVQTFVVSRAIGVRVLAMMP